MNPEIPTVTDWRGARVVVGDLLIYRGRYRMVEAVVEEMRFSVTSTGVKTSVWVKPTEKPANRWDWVRPRRITMKYATRVERPPV